MAIEHPDTTPRENGWAEAMRAERPGDHVAYERLLKEIRQSPGTAVFGGMLSVTAFGLIFTPAFCTIVQRTGLARRRDQGVESNRSVAANPGAG